MEQLINRISLTYSDSEINALLKRSNYHAGNPPALYFSHNEELFLTTAEEYRVPSFGIHHDVNVGKPREEYLSGLRETLEQFLPMTGAAFQELSYFFDPAEIFKPSFFRLFSINGALYLYLLRIDLGYRPTVHRVAAPGSNDISPSYLTDRLYFESDLIPLREVVTEKNRVQAFVIDQLIGNTWAGERGRGYLTQGIWKDREFSKYFTKLFIPAGKRLYPYYPFACKYRTISLALLDLSPDGRKRYLPLLHHAVKYLRPHMNAVERDLSGAEFSEKLSAFMNLRKKVPVSWLSVWDGYSVDAYINNDNQKEFRIDFPHQ